MTEKQNIDRLETEKFAKMADNWWDPNGACKPLHIINQARLEFISSKLNINNKKVLDVGCGGGILTESLFSLGAKATGIDATAEVIEAAKLHATQNNKNIDYINITSEEYAKNNENKFDVIVCMELLEHVPDPRSLIKSLTTMLKPNGEVFFSTINRTPQAYLLAIIGAEYVLKLLPKRTHSYEKFITPVELASWCRENQLQLESVKGIFYNPLSNKSSLINNTSVNYIAYGKKL